MFYRLNGRYLVFLVNPLQRLLSNLHPKYTLLSVIIAIYAINILVIRRLQLGIYINHLQPKGIHLLLVKY